MNKFKNILEGCFWLFYLSSIIVLIYRPEHYIRPLSFLVLLAFAVAIVGVQVSLYRSKIGKVAYLHLAKICLVVLTLQWSILCLYSSSYIGFDPYYHDVVINKIQMGEVTKFDYYGTQIFHYLVAGSALLFGISNKVAMMIFVGLPYSVGILTICYKLGQLLFNDKVGLYGTVVLSTASLFIFFGVEIIPSSLAILFLMISIYLILRYQGVWYIYLIIGILLLVIIKTNSIVALFTVAVLGLIWLGSLIYKRDNQKHYLAIAASFSIVLIVLWIYTKQIDTLWRVLGNILISSQTVNGTVAMDGGTSVLDMSKQALGDGSTTASSSAALTANVLPEMSEAISNYYSNIPLIEILIKKANVFIYGGLGGLGALVYLYRRKLQPRTFYYILMALAILILSVVNGVLSEFYFLSRHIQITQILIAPVIGYLLYNLLENLKIWRYLIVGIVVLGLGLVSFISPLTSVDSAKLTPDLTYRQAMTEGEIEGIDYICTNHSGDIMSDWICSNYIYYKKQVKDDWKINEVKDLSRELYSRDFSDIKNNTIIIVRKEILNNPVLMLDSVYKFGYDPEDILMKQGYHKYYDNEYLNAYIHD